MHAYADYTGKNRQSEDLMLHESHVSPTCDNNYRAVCPSVSTLPLPETPLLRLTRPGEARQDTRSNTEVNTEDNESHQRHNAHPTGETEECVYSQTRRKKPEEDHTFLLICQGRQ
jgi:hypothetical protein